MSDRAPEQEARRALTGKIAELAVDAILHAGFVILRGEAVDRADAEMRRLQDENAILRAEVEYLTGRLASRERAR